MGKSVVNNTKKLKEVSSNFCKTEPFLPFDTEEDPQPNQTKAPPLFRKKITMIPLMLVEEKRDKISKRIKP
jgi:hypothetical protein